MVLAVVAKGEFDAYTVRKSLGAIPPLAEAGRWAEVSGLAESALQRDPDNAAGLLWQARAALEHGTPPDLPKVREWAGETDEFGLGVVVVELAQGVGDWEMGRTVLERIARDRPGDLRLPLLFARQAEGEGDLLRQRRWLATVFDGDPSNPEAHLMMGRLLVAAEAPIQQIRGVEHLFQAAADTGSCGLEAIRLLAANQDLLVAGRSRDRFAETVDRNRLAGVAEQLSVAELFLSAHPENREAILDEVIRTWSETRRDEVETWLRRQGEEGRASALQATRSDRASGSGEGMNLQ